MHKFCISDGSIEFHSHGEPKKRTKAHHSTCNCITREDLRCAGYLQYKETVRISHAVIMKHSVSKEKL